MTSAKSLGLNINQSNLIVISGQQPCIKVNQAEIVAKVPKQSPIALFTINKLLVRFGPLATVAKAKAADTAE